MNSMPAVACSRSAACAYAHHQHAHQRAPRVLCARSEADTHVALMPPHTWGAAAAQEFGILGGGAEADDLTGHVQEPELVHPPTAERAPATPGAPGPPLRRRRHEEALPPPPRAAGGAAAVRGAEQLGGRAQALWRGDDGYGLKSGGVQATRAAVRARGGAQRTSVEHLQRPGPAPPERRRARVTRGAPPPPPLRRSAPHATQRQGAALKPVGHDMTRGRVHHSSGACVARPARMRRVCVEGAGGGTQS